MRVWRTVAGFTALVGIMGIASADAQPARIILLRHGEKKNARELCNVGNLRAQALSAQYLGKGAPGSTELFGAGKSPDAFFAVTAHTKETAAPSAGTWGKKLTIFPVLPRDPEEETDLDTQTQKAAAALNSAEYDGKIVVVVWEHRHIANAKLDTTFWKLLNLDQLPGSPGVPDTWSGGNYDYFWIVDYAPGNPKPVQWRPVKQVFSTPYTSIPANQWGDPEPDLPGCK